MSMHDLIRELREPSETKIVLLVADGLGGLPMEAGGKTELESARTPNLDACAREGVCGLSTPVLPGITPGSGPGHLGLFGYDPLQYRIGRGILEALGINFQVGPRCVAVCRLLHQIKVPGVEVFVEPVREHRFVVVFRGGESQVMDTMVPDLGD